MRRFLWPGLQCTLTVLCLGTVLGRWRLTILIGVMWESSLPSGRVSCVMWWPARLV